MFGDCVCYNVIIEAALNLYMYYIPYGKCSHLHCSSLDCQVRNVLIT